MKSSIRAPAAIEARVATLRCTTPSKTLKSDLIALGGRGGGGDGSSCDGFRMTATSEDATSTGAVVRKPPGKSRGVGHPAQQALQQRITARKQPRRRPSNQPPLPQQLHSRGDSLALRSFLPLPCSTRITMLLELMSDTRRLATSDTRRLAPP